MHPQGRWTMSFLTFDEWHLKRYGTSFEEKWMQGHMQTTPALKALTKELREYTSEMIVQALLEKPRDS